MAILKPFECTVSVDGVSVEEYDDDDDDNDHRPGAGPQVTKYIEAVSGAGFVTHFKIEPGWTMNADFLVWDIYLDGKRARGSVISPDRYSEQIGCRQKLAGYESGTGDNWTRRNFRFTDITTGT